MSLCKTCGVEIDKFHIVCNECFNIHKKKNENISNENIIVSPILDRRKYYNYIKETPENKKFYIENVELIRIF